VEERVIWGRRWDTSWRADVRALTWFWRAITCWLRDVTSVL
jgi:hypothetical protein